MAASNTSKRKRNQVSYLADDYFDSMDLDNTEEHAAAAPESDEDEDAQSEADTTFGSRKKAKPKKKKAKTAKKAKAKKTKPFRFLDLPAELRDEIYELALTDPEGLTVVSTTRARRHVAMRGRIILEDGSNYYGKYRPNARWYTRRNRETSTFGSQSRDLLPSLLAVNQQVREEGSSILYKQEIVVDDMATLHTFLAQIGHYNRQLLEEVTVKGWGVGRGVQKASNYAAFTMLSTCPNLRSLYLDCTVGYSTIPARLARQIYTDGHHFFESFGFANGKYDAILDILELSDRNFEQNFIPWRRAVQLEAQEETETEKEAKISKNMKEFESELRAWLS